MSDTLQVVHWRLDAQRSGVALCFLDDGEFEAAAERSRTASDLEESFERTAPRWYGLWLDQPLSPSQCRILLKLFEAADASSGAADPKFAMTGPLRLAVAEGIPLQVEVAPPGHADLGMLTTFVHCPRCKCEGPLPRWQSSYPADLQFCECCGQAYSPASTYSSDSEYAVSTFECAQCGQIVKGRSLTDEQLGLLELADNHRDELTEFEWLERVAAFYRRCPAARAFFESRRPSVDANDVVEFVPKIREFRVELPGAADNDPWKTEDAEVIDYLDRHIFSLESRWRAISQSLNAWSMETHPDVRCKACGGELHRCRQP